MASVIEELLSQGSVDPAALARQLRRENEYGMVGALSGSSQLAPMAEQVQQNAGKQAAFIGNARREQANADSSAAAALERWKAEMKAKQDEGAADRSLRERLAREGFASDANVANIRARNAKKDATEANSDEIARQMEEALAIAETRVQNAGSDGGPIMGRSGLGTVTGQRDAFEGDIAPLSNAVRAQIRLHFRDASQSNIELQAFEQNLPKWEDLPETRAAKLENIRRVYSPQSIAERASKGKPGAGVAPRAGGAVDPIEAERIRRGL